MEKEQNGRYDDILDHPYPLETRRPRMSMTDRAGQFSPFAALTGYEAAVEEAARLTDEQREMTEDMKATIDGRLRFLADRLEEEPMVTVTYFVPDKRKKGGAYLTVTDRVREIDEIERCLVLAERGRIPIEVIRELECELPNESE